MSGSRWLVALVLLLAPLVVHPAAAQDPPDADADADDDKDRAQLLAELQRLRAEVADLRERVRRLERLLLDNEPRVPGGTVDPPHPAERAVPLAFPVSGRVVEVAEHGPVAAGAVLAALDTADAELQLRAAMMAYQQARAEAELADTRVQAAEAALESSQQAVKRLTDDLERIKQLAINGVASEAELNAARAAVEQAQAASQQAAARLEERRTEVQMTVLRVRDREVAIEQARLQLERHVLRAPSDGRVTKVLAVAGTVVAPGTPVLVFRPRADGEEGASGRKEDGGNE